MRKLDPLITYSDSQGRLFIAVDNSKALGRRGLGFGLFSRRVGWRAENELSARLVAKEWRVSLCQIDEEMGKYLTRSTPKDSKPGNRGSRQGSQREPARFRVVLD